MVIGKSSLKARFITSDTCDALPVCLFWVCYSDSESSLKERLISSGTCNVLSLCLFCYCGSNCLKARLLTNNTNDTLP